MLSLLSMFGVKLTFKSESQSSSGVLNPDITSKQSPNIESKESINDVTICDELTVEQKQQLHDLLSDYSDIFSDVPQVTNVINHLYVRTIISTCLREIFFLFFHLF
jgi:hypothetical protein